MDYTLRHSQSDVYDFNANQNMNIEIENILYLSIIRVWDWVSMEERSSYILFLKDIHILIYASSFKLIIVICKSTICLSHHRVSFTNKMKASGSFCFFEGNETGFDYDCKCDLLWNMIYRYVVTISTLFKDKL